MSGRRLIAIIVGVVGIVLLALVAFLLLRQQDEPSSAQPPAPTQAPQSGDGEVQEEVAAVTPSPTIDPNVTYVNVVVSLQTVPRGWQMTEAELDMDERIASQVGPGVLTSFEEAIGLYARQEIFQGQSDCFQ